MRLATFGLFTLIVGTGAFVETVYQVRDKVPGGRFRWSLFHGRFQGPSHSFDQPGRTIPLAPGTAVEVSNAFGNVRMSPGAGPEARVTLRTVVYDEDGAAAANLARQVMLVTETTPSGLRITTNRDQVESSQTGPRQAGIETHLEMLVPVGTPARVRNEHGDATVWDVASLDLENAFGATDVQRVAGTARVANRHGDTRVSEVQGTLTLESRHGDAEAHRTGGAVKLEVEHGDALLVECGTVDAQFRHGALTAQKVTGDLLVQGEHAEVTGKGVSGRARVTTGYRDVVLEDVGLDVAVESQHGGITLTRVAGAAKLKTRHDRVEMTDVKGAVDVEVENGTVVGRNLAGGATIRARHDAVTIEGFSGPVQIVAEQTSVDLVSSAALTQPVSVKTSHDDVRVVLPTGSAVEVDAAAAHGEVRVDLPGLTTSTSEEHRVAGRVGTSGPRLSIEAENGSIRVETGGSAPR